MPPLEKGGICGDGGNADAPVSILTGALRHVRIEPPL